MAYQPKSYRKFVATAATATLVATAFAPFASAASFTDVEDKYKDAVDFLVSKGVNGYADGTFKTQKTITRIEAAEILGKALGLDKVTDAPASGFTDVPARVATLINAFKAEGITTGKTATTFAPNAEITRGELAVWIQRAYDLKAKEIIIRNAENDIANILHAMYPAKETMHLYRTSWMDKVYTSANSFSYSREYPALQFSVGSMVEIKTISSCSLTPYRENDDVGSDFYRYEITVPCNMPILELDQFITHNEEGEVLLPPMRCKVIGIRTAMIGRRKGIVELEYVQSLS